MTESLGNEPRGALFARIAQMVQERGADIRQQQSGNALKLEFADGQRILINFDAQTSGVWLAARSGGIEFAYRNGQWRAHDQSEFFDKLQHTIEQTIASNPLNARPPQAPEPVAAQVYVQHEAHESNALRNLFVLILVLASGYWGAQWLSRPQADETGGEIATFPARQFGATQDEIACENILPRNGDITVFPGSELRADGPNDPAITLNNDHAYPMLLILSAPRSAIPALSVLVHARQSAALHLPAGQYDMMFSAGSSWCNARKGFSDGQRVKYEQPLQVTMDKPMVLAMQSTGAGQGDFQLFVHVERPPEEVPKPSFSGDGSMEVKRAANGHFYLPGSIENVPATFMVDTGASVTSISSAIARQAGITNCKEVQFQTANGNANGCIALVSNMTLGNFQLKNITVAVMPNMEINLLGSNVLRNFQVSQSGSEMLIGFK